MVTGATIAVIPARGGSKRIPRKNIVDFFGKPLIAWTIEAALASNLFHRVLVSTDDAEIAEIARRYGAEAPFLRQTAADDQSHVSGATISALDQAAVHWSEDYATVVQLMPNCPLRETAEIADALSTFRKRLARFQISCFKYGWMNPWWAVSLDANQRPVPIFQDTMKARSQDLGSLYCPTGAIWIADIAALKQAGTFYGPDHTFYPLHWSAAVDIDDAEDMEMARAVYLMRQHMPVERA